MVKRYQFSKVEIKFKQFLFYFFSEKYGYKYRNYIECCVNSEKKTFKIFLVDLRNFDYIFYKLVLCKPLECVYCFEFLVLQIINDLTIYKFLQIKNLDLIQVLLVETKKPLNRDIFCKFKMNVLVFFKIIVLLLTKIQLKSVKVNNFFKYISKKNTFERFFNKQINFIRYQFGKVQIEFPEIKFVEKNSTTILLEKKLVDKLHIGQRYFITGMYILKNTFVNFSIKVNFIRDTKLNGKLIIRVLGVYLTDHSKIKILKNKKILSVKFFVSTIRSLEIYNWTYSLVIPSVLNCIRIKKNLACLFFGGKNRSFFNNCKFREEINIFYIHNKLSLKNEIFNFIKDLNEFNKNQTTTHTIDSVKNKKNYLFYKNIVENLNLLCVENFERLSTKYKKKIYNSIETQIFYFKSKEEKNTKSPTYSFLCSIDEKFFQNLVLNCSNNQILNLDSKILKEFDVFFLDKRCIKTKKYNSDTNFTLSFFTTFNGFYFYKKTIKTFKKYTDFIRINFDPMLSKNAIKILKKAYIHMRIVQKNTKIEIRFPFLEINLNKLESIVKISESLAKMRMSYIIDCGDILNSIEVIQKEASGISNLLMTADTTESIYIHSTPLIKKPLH